MRTKWSPGYSLHKLSFTKKILSFRYTESLSDDEEEWKEDFTAWQQDMDEWRLAFNDYQEQTTCP